MINPAHLASRGTCIEQHSDSDVSRWAVLTSGATTVGPR
jgi:hypothetical protein